MFGSTGGFSFGNTAGAQQTQGATSASNIFGQPQIFPAQQNSQFPQQQSFTGFRTQGQPQILQQGLSGFQNFNPSQTNLQQQQAQQQPAPSGSALLFLGDPIAQSLLKIQNSYAPLKDQQSRPLASGEGKANEECEFKAVMYNRRAHPAKHHSCIPLTGALLEQAEQNNTHPDEYAPVREVGICALAARFDEQNKEAALCGEQVRSLNNILNRIESSNAATMMAYENIKRKQVALFQQLLTILRKLEVLRCHGNVWQPAEQRFQEKLLKLLDVVREPNERLQEVANSLVQQEHNRDLYAEVDSEEDLLLLHSALQKQRESIETVADLLTKDLRDVSIVKREMGLTAL